MAVSRKIMSSFYIQKLDKNIGEKMENIKKDCLERFKKVKSTLKPCPFCGSTYLHFPMITPNEEKCYGKVECLECMACSANHLLPNSFNNVIKTWNRRG